MTWNLRQNWLHVNNNVLEKWDNYSYACGRIITRNTFLEALDSNTNCLKYLLCNILFMFDENDIKTSVLLFVYVIKMSQVYIEII